MSSFYFRRYLCFGVVFSAMDLHGLFVVGNDLIAVLALDRSMSSLDMPDQVRSAAVLHVASRASHALPRVLPGHVPLELLLILEDRSALLALETLVLLDEFWTHAQPPQLPDVASGSHVDGLFMMRDRIAIDISLCQDGDVHPVLSLENLDLRVLLSELGPQHLVVLRKRHYI